jgi:hypothetical protein
MKKVLFFLVATTLFSMVACEKNNKPSDSKPDIAGKTNLQIFQMQPWRFNYWGDSAENDVIWTDEMDACMKDDIYKFTSNTKYWLTEGSNKCYPNDYEGDWLIPSENSTKITFLGYQWDLVHKSNEKLILFRMRPDTEVHYQRVILSRD